MNQKMKIKDGSAQLKIAGTLAIILGVLGMLSMGFLQTQTAATLLTAEQIASQLQPDMVFANYWYAILDIVFGVFAFYFAKNPQKNSLCQAFSIGISISYVVVIVMYASGWTEKIIAYSFIVVPMLYAYGANKQKEYYSKQQTQKS